MNILIIALPGAGKTTMITSIYGHFRMARSGISLKAEDDKELIQRFRAIRHGIFPDKTMTRRVYDMIFKYENQEICPVRFIDYQGGIFAPDYEASQFDIKALEKDIKECDCVLCLIESGDFNQYNEFIRQSLEVLGHVLKNSHYIKPIGFVITKSDILKTPLTHNDYYRVLGPILNMPEGNNRLVFGVFSISCIGDLHPVEAPLCFLFLFCAIKEGIERIKSEVLSINAKVEELNNRSLFKDFKDWWIARLHTQTTEREKLIIRHALLMKFAEMTDASAATMFKMLGQSLIIPSIETIDFESVWEQ